MAGVLRSVQVTRGQRVRAGEIVARLESGVEEATVALNEARAESTAEIEQRRARLDFAQSEVGRAAQLAEGRFVSAQRVEELRAALRSAQQDLAIAQLNRRLAELELARSRAALEQRVIRAPVDGVVTERVLGPGEYMHHDNHVVILAATDPLHVEAFPPVRWFGAIRPGQVAQVHFEAPLARTLPATVSVIDEVFDAGSGSFGVRLVLANPTRLPAGLRCRVTFQGLEEPRAAAAAGPRAAGN